MEHFDTFGLDNNELPGLALCTIADLIQTQNGPIIGIFHNYAHHGKGNTVHSINQLKYFGITVDNTPLTLLGKQCIITPDGYRHPIQIHKGFPWMDMKATNPNAFGSTSI